MMVMLVRVAVFRRVFVFVFVRVFVFVFLRQFFGVAEAALRDGDFDAVNAAPRNVVGANVPIFDGQRGQIGFEFVERRAAIEQRGQSHIARDAAKAIEICNFH